MDNMTRRSALAVRANVLLKSVEVEAQERIQERVRGIVVRTWRVKTRAARWTALAL